MRSASVIARKMDRSIARLAPALLAEMEDEVAERGRKIGCRDPVKLHAIRKSLKKLRYAAEDMQSVFPRKKGKRFVKSARKLEKKFGRLNDMASARRLLAILGADGDAGLLPAIAAMDMWCENREKKMMAGLEKGWRKYREAPRFWE